MLGYVKRILRKWVETPEEEPAASVASPAPAPARQLVMAPRAEPPRAPRNGSHQNGRGVELPLQTIVNTLPLELQPQLRSPDAGTLTISIPLEKILGQLSRGAVKITFGELRQAAPDLFNPDENRDSVMVPLPLGEILPRLNPALITRRRVQKQIQVPTEIRSPFDPGNASFSFSIGQSRAEAAPARPPLPPARQTAPPTPSPVVPPARNNLTFAPTPPPPAATPPAPAGPIPFPAAIRMPKAPEPTPPATPAIPPAPPAPIPMPAPAPVASPAPAPAPAEAPVAASAAPVPDGPPLLVNLTSLAEGWPEPVRQELVQFNLVDAKVALPAELVERALKQGRVAFTWKTLRSWIKPLPKPVASAHDSTVLELPLKVVAPVFLTRQREAAAVHKKVEIDAEIPNLFFGFPKSESASAVVASAASSSGARPADTNFYVWDDTSDRARIQDDEVKRGPSPGTKFIAKYATPNEVVSRAAALEGVAGALIALPDGLMVASRLSSDLNGDTLAAFLPQIFGKINQCTKELRMGELNNVNFTVGNIPWKIFRVNAIFFAAFGRAGEPLPTAQLAALAAELDHRPK